MKTLENFETEVVALLEENELNFDLMGASDESTFIITGWTYNVTASITEFDGEISFYCDTTHKEKYRSLKRDGDTSDATANIKHFKSLKGVKSYILKWTDK